MTGQPAFVLQPGSGAERADPADPAAGTASATSAAVEMWLAALGGGRVATATARVPSAVPEPVDRRSLLHRDDEGGLPSPPLALTEAVAPSPLATIARRWIARLRRGSATVDAENPALAEGVSTSDAATDIALRGERAAIGDPRMVELDRPPLVVVSRPAEPARASGPDTRRGGGGAAVASPTADEADPALDVDADADEPDFGTVIPLVHRFNESLDEELMRELAGGDGAEPPPPPPDHGAAGRAAPTAAAEPQGPGAAPVFVGATRRITFFSLNGGSGRTTLATEVACLLAARGRHRPDPDRPSERLRVALLDLDMRSSNVAVRLGIPRPTIWDYLLATGADAEDVRRFLVTHPSGLRALLGPPKPLSTAAAAVEPARIAEIVHQLERDGCHFLVVDLGSDLGAVSTWVLSQVHDIYVVITATGSGMQDAYRTTETLRRLGLGHKLRYVVNRARGAVNVDEVMGDLGGRVVATIPYDHRLEDAENAHRIASLQGGGPAAQAIVRLASTIYPTIGEQRPRRRLIGRSRAG